MTGYKKSNILRKIASIYKNSPDINELYGFIVLAAENKTYNELLEFFKQRFPADFENNPNKSFAVARQ